MHEKGGQDNGQRTSPLHADPDRGMNTSQDMVVSWLRCRDGGIGRHTGLKIPWRLTPWGFDSPSRHFLFKTICTIQKMSLEDRMGQGGMLTILELSGKIELKLEKAGEIKTS
jgi:hypothetical protein